MDFEELTMTMFIEKSAYQPPAATVGDTTGIRTQRKGSKRIYALIGGLVLLSTLPGCATFAKCGFAGCPGDAKITADVEAEFRRYADLSPPNLLNVRTLDHVVYLSGMTSTGLQRDHAEEVARQASDGARVVDSIGVVQ
jgi:hypothetical protein